ncbi:molecular chaperone Hsp20 [Methanosarcina sp. 2.H.T.1A.6]|jgi:HSP20 family protein|uniref:archaeal heat shock protein Hsp20 n=1 Tax=unclassified Methanosarcina TaxID=2644672 RepID=UPI00062228F8|nr:MULTISPECIES: archaeal heat shock protein Hsp20 [unclassified Methanosarcina]KKG08622.1 molecular chaperone Hsp20 [Methanosarcina sp. 2.H.A.1B.4]KKG14480.1 molecular chaperone Hsp20 [Methanosarcina sp. 2.H.T.1A.3]KKG18641.1 molecular chaperone Hsp20 [Methanosarcina sp. 2.H.T.1A.15]KKG24268.1 molecular chaperone Hsp20 [Methanosarcina sp. 2.H.T.1A.8]KKG24919.1 molecular chaperone Hsp20 [Methanosarcina sp. 2.H.T.1A.6]
MDRDRRKRSFFDEIFGIDPLKDMDEMFERLSRAMGMSMDNFGQHPFVYGFSVTQRAGEEPEIREFGNIPMFEQMETGEKRYLDIRKPLIDVLESEEKVHVVAEMPGIEKENIQLNATDLILDIETLDGNPKYSERVELPVKVDPQSAKATYKNGVLEVTFNRLESSSRTSIDIE